MAAFYGHEKAGQACAHHSSTEHRLSASNACNVSACIWKKTLSPHAQGSGRCETSTAQMTRDHPARQFAFQHHELGILEPQLVDDCRQSCGNTEAPPPEPARCMQNLNTIQAAMAALILIAS